MLAALALPVVPSPLMAIFPQSNVPEFFTATTVLSAIQQLTIVVTCFIQPHRPLYLVQKQESSLRSSQKQKR